MISLNDFSGLTVISYDRGQMGEFYSHLLHLEKFNKSEATSHNNMWKATKTEKSYDALTYTPMINTAATIFSKKIYGKTIHQMIIDHEYDEAKKTLLSFINLSDFIDNDAFYDAISKNKFNELKILMHTDDYYDDVITRYHNYNMIDLTKIFTNCNHINFYCSSNKRWIFILLYFYKKIVNKVYAGHEWLINNETDLINFFHFVVSSSNSIPLDNAININAFDLFNIKNKIHKNEETKFLVYKNIKANIDIITNLGYDINNNEVNIEETVVNLYRRFFK
jgi:hypothetical protein